MSFAALCGSQARNSATPPLSDAAAAASARAVALCGCALASSAGGLKSSCASLLELSPTPEPNSSACTLSERGGARLGAFFFAGSFGGAGCPGVSSGNERSRLRPEASRFPEGGGEAGGEDGGGEGGGEFCCAHDAQLSPNSKHKYKCGRHCMSLFYRRNRALWKGVSRQVAVRNQWKKSRPLRGEELSGLVSKVLRGRRNSCCLNTIVLQRSSYSDEGLF